MDAADRKAQREKRDKSAAFLTANPGWNRFVWNLRPAAFRRSCMARIHSSSVCPVPAVVPGDYQVTLRVDEQEVTQPFTLVKDATGEATHDELGAPIRPAAPDL